MKQCDLNGDGVLSKQEFDRFLDGLQETKFSPKEKALLYRTADNNGNGQVSYEEFLEFVLQELELEKVLEQEGRPAPKSAWFTQKACGRRAADGRGRDAFARRPRANLEDPQGLREE